MKNVLAVIAGFIVGSIAVFVIGNLIGHSLFPLPEGADPMNPEWISNNMDKIPVGAKVFVVISHLIGIVVGMYIAAKISKKTMIPVYIVGVLFLLATLYNTITLPKELWFNSSDVLFTILGFFIGKFLAQKQITKV